MALIRHTVRAGECCSSIAKHYGLADSRAIYEHAANADLRAKRRANVLHPGDIVMVPENAAREERVATEQRHHFRLKREPTVLRIVLSDMDDNALANHPYRLDLPGASTRQGRTDGTGMLEEPIPPDLTSATLKFEIREDGMVFPCSIPLEVGHLNPVDEDVGVQERLSNLGYACGAYDGHLGERTQVALRRFQMANGLEVTGAADPPTRRMLEQIHGS